MRCILNRMGKKGLRRKIYVSIDFADFYLFCHPAASYSTLCRNCSNERNDNMWWYELQESNAVTNTHNAYYFITRIAVHISIFVPNKILCRERDGMVNRPAPAAIDRIHNIHICFILSIPICAYRRRYMRCIKHEIKQTRILFSNRRQSAYN